MFFIENFLLFGLAFSPVLTYGFAFEKGIRDSSKIVKYMKFIPFILLEVLVSTCILKLIDIYLLNNVFMKDFFPVVLVAVTGLVSRILFFVVKKIDVDNHLFFSFYIFSFGVVFFACKNFSGLLSALGSAFIAVLMMFFITASIYFGEKRLKYSNVPYYARGVPLLLVIFAIISMAFYGLSSSWWFSAL